MRLRSTAAVLTVISLTGMYPCALNGENVPTSSDPNAVLTALENKADQAQPKDRCLLYAELVNRMTDLAGRQLGSGDDEEASATLALVQHYAAKIQADPAAKTYKLKNAEVLIERTCFRLKDILDSASYQNRQMLEATLKELNEIQTQLMLQVFKR